MQDLVHLAAPADLPAEPSFDAPLDTLRAQCARVLSETLVLHISESEPGDPAQRALEIGHATSLVARALDLLDVMAVLFGDAPGAPMLTISIPFDEELDLPLRDEPAREPRVEELVAAARFVLRYHQRRLAPGALGPQAARRVGAAREALRSVAERFAELEGALLDGERAAVRIDSPEHTVAELAQLRRRYVAFHRVVSPERMPADEALSRRLRMIALGLVRLLGDTDQLRIPREDRAMLMIARDVVRDWLRGGGEPSERAAEGRRLVNRLRALASRLVHVNELQIAMVIGRGAADFGPASFRPILPWPTHDTLPSFGALLARTASYEGAATGA